MSYADVADLAVYGLQSNATSGLDPADLQRALDGASRFADSYLTGRGYPLPLTTWEDDLRSAVAKIAAWNILVHMRGVNVNDGGHAALKMDHDGAVSWLKDVAKGVANLTVSGTAPARTTAPMIAVFSTALEDPREW